VKILVFLNEEDNNAIYYGVEPLPAASMKVVIKKAVRAYIHRIL